MFAIEYLVRTPAAEDSRRLPCSCEAPKTRPPCRARHGPSIGINAMRWLWIDRFLEFRPGKSARAVKNLSLAEDVFADHFPGYPIMPASLILEGLAQTGGILVGQANDF